MTAHESKCERVATLEYRMRESFKISKERERMLCLQIGQLERDKKLLEAQVRNLSDLLKECQPLWKEGD
jgi:hypothetical protein